MKVGKLLGILFIIFSVATLAFNFKVTGAVIGVAPWRFVNWISLIFLIVGLGLIIESDLEKDLAAEALKSGAIITDPRKILKMAHKMGYYDGDNVREGHQILDNSGKVLTVIPRHHLSGGVYRSIMKSLSTGKSSFRQYQHSY